MMAGHKGEWWKAALLSGAVSGIVGPGIGTAALLLANASVANLIQALIDFLRYWLVAVVIIGPVAFVLGCAGGLLLKALTAKCASMGAVVVIAATLGLSFGSAVPFGVVVVSTLTEPGHFINWSATKATAGTGAIAGLVCAILVLCLLRLTELLHLRRSDLYAPLSE